MFMPQLQTLSYSWSLVPSAVGICSHSYVNLRFRSRKAHCWLSFKKCWICLFWTHNTAIFLGTDKVSYSPRRAGGTEAQDFRKTAAAIYGGEQACDVLYHCVGNHNVLAFGLILERVLRIRFVYFFMHSYFLSLQLSCVFVVFVMVPFMWRPSRGRICSNDEFAE
jgi:hypothetical protein